MMKRMMGKVLLVLCCTGLIINLYGADDAPSRRSRRSRGERGERGQRGNMVQMMFGRMIAEAKIAEAAPEKYAALEAAREKYEAELAALARETGVNLPLERDEAYRKIRKQFPAEFAALMKKMESDPRQAMMELQQLAEKAGVKLNVFRGGNDRSRNRAQGDGGVQPRKINRPKLEDLRRKYPEQMQQYDELRKTDRPAAAKLLREIIEQDRKTKQ